MKAEIVCVGTELLLGDIVNTNAAYLAKELAAAGIDVYHQSVIGDNPQRLEAELTGALSRCDLVITTGGLGPTYDDLTKETAARLFHREMELNLPSLERIEAFFRKIDRPMTENNRKQAMIPRGARVLSNDNGTAPGILLEEDGRTLVLLPGPPREMQPMFQKEVLPYLCERSGSVLVSRNVHIFGMGESQVEDILRPMMERLTNPTVAPYAKEGEVLLRVTAKAKDRAEALARIDPVIADIRKALGPVIYGIDVGSLQAAAVQALAARGLTAATAESCTGGAIAARFTAIPGASAYFRCGVVSYSNESKVKLLDVNPADIERYGAVSEQVARQMAEGARRAADADYAVATTGIAGPTGGSAEKPVGTVWIAVSSPERTVALLKQCGTDRGQIIDRASAFAVGLLRDCLNGK